MPLPFEFEGKGVMFEPFPGEFDTLNRKFVSSEPTSILDNTFNSSSTPSPPASSSTLSSSLGTGTGTGGNTSGVAAVPGQKWPPEIKENASSNVGLVAASADHFHPFPVEIHGATAGTAAGAMEDWDNDGGQEQSILRWIMGDVEDPFVGLTKVLSAAPGGGVCIGLGTGDLGFNNFDILDYGFGFDSNANNPVGQFPNKQFADH